MAAPAPVVVNIPAPATPDSPLHLSANDALVAALPWMPWGVAPAIGGVPQVTIRLHEAIAAFLIRCCLSKTPAAIASYNPVNILTFKLTAAQWATILTAIRDGGLAARTISCREELHEYLRAIPAQVPNPFELDQNSWALFPALLAGGNAAQRAMVKNIRYLSLANISQLEITHGALAAYAPFTVICMLAGAIGAVGTNAARLLEASSLQSVAETIRDNSVGGKLDGALAHNLRATIQGAIMAKELRAHGVTVEELSEELTDTFSALSSGEMRVAIECKRLHYISLWYSACPLAPCCTACLRGPLSRPPRRVSAHS